MVLNNFIKAACLSTCLGLASGSVLANTYNVESNGGLRVYDSNSSDHWFNLNGKMQLDQNFFHASNINSSMDLRSVQATVKGGVGEDLSYSFRVKRSGDSVAMDKSQVTYAGFNSWSRVSVGQVSMPYGLGTSFTEDSLTTDLFSPNANNSLGVAVTAWNDNIGFSCSIHQPTSDAVNSVARLDSAVRASFAPLMRDNLTLHLGLNAYVQQAAGSFSSSLAHNANSDNAVTLQMDKDAQKRGFGVDAAVLRGPLFLQAEFHQVSVGQSENAMGYNVEASFALTGESRSYDKITGSFGSITTDRDGGSWQVSARHSGVQYDNKMHRTVGASLAWTVNNNLTVLANYENALTQNRQGALSLRLQAAW